MSTVNKSRYSSRITLPGTVEVPEEETVKNAHIEQEWGREGLR